MANMMITIPDEKIEEFKMYFVKCNPVPLDPDIHEPTMSVIAWIREWTKRKLVAEYKKGKRQAAREATEIDENIVE